MTVMNFLHDASHAVFWVITATVLSELNRPLLSAAALALAGLSLLYASRNIVHRETLMKMRRKRSEEVSVRQPSK